MSKIGLLCFKYFFAFCFEFKSLLFWYCFEFRYSDFEFYIITKDARFCVYVSDKGSNEAIIV